jgi:hypothetical protein
MRRDTRAATSPCAGGEHAPRRHEKPCSPPARETLDDAPARAAQRSPRHACASPQPWCPPALATPASQAWRTSRGARCSPEERLQRTRRSPDCVADASGCMCGDPQLLQGGRSMYHWPTAPATWLTPGAAAIAASAMLCASRRQRLALPSIVWAIWRCAGAVALQKRHRRDQQAVWRGLCRRGTDLERAI